MRAMREISFRPLTLDDMQAMFLWLLRPHVAKWYAPKPASFAEAVAKYGPRTLPGSPVKAFVIAVDGADAGYIQSYPLAEFPDYAARIGSEAGAAGIDLFIGEEHLLGWGLGAGAVRKFVDELAFADPATVACYAGPLEGNAAATRTFAKAGFTPWKVVVNERGENEQVMRRGKQGVRLLVP